MSRHSKYELTRPAIDAGNFVFRALPPRLFQLSLRPFPLIIRGTHPLSVVSKPRPEST